MPVRRELATLCLAVMAGAQCRPASTARGTPARQLSPTEDRSLARADHAQGDFTVAGTSVPLRHAYAVLERTDPRDTSYVRILLTDVPVATLDSADLYPLVDAGKLHYVEVSVGADDAEIRTVNYCHAGMGKGCLSTATLVGEGATHFAVESFAGHQVSGRLSLARPGNSQGTTYTFSAQFRATLWETTGRHLGPNADGSFGVKPGRAMGTFTMDGVSFPLAYAYARPDETGTQVLLTEKPMAAADVDRPGELRSAHEQARVRGLGFVVVDAEGRAKYWDWNTGSVAYGGFGNHPDMRLERAAVAKGLVAGTVYTPRPLLIDNHLMEFKATYQAVLASP